MQRCADVAVHTAPVEKAADRYRALAAEVRRSGHLWVLSHPVEEAWATYSDPRGHVVVPVWPGQDEAVTMASGSWEGLRPVAVPVGEFVAHEVPELEAEGVLIAAHPTPTSSGAAVRASHFARALRDAS
jgi:hypothetical protein